MRGIPRAIVLARAWTRSSNFPRLMTYPAERRCCHRYSITLDMQFMIRKHGKLSQGGEGKIRDVSRLGILFTSSTPLAPGTALRLVVDWPVRFQGKTSVDWIVDAVVVRHNDAGTAVNIMRQRFERRSRTKEERLAG